jgi:5-methylcytosine-specific restriction endonuclease McrA
VVDVLGMRLVVEECELTPDVARAFRKQENRQRWDADRRERLRTNGPRDRYTVEESGGRDGWTCQICGDPVDPDLRKPDPESRSLDHVVPVSRGGADTLANVRLTHLGCNLDRNVSERPAYGQRMRAARLARRPEHGMAHL